MWKLWKTLWAIILLWQFHRFHFLPICRPHSHSSNTHTDRHTHTYASRVIIFLTASTDVRKADFSTSRWEGEGKAISAPEKDKSYVGGPGVLCKNSKVARAWIHTSRHVDTEGQGDWKGDPFTRMTATPLVSPGSISFQHILFFFILQSDMFVRFFPLVIITMTIRKGEQENGRDSE